MRIITVSGGSGSIFVDFGHDKFEAISLVSPDNTPLYDFQIINAKGSLVLGASGINAQMTKIVEPFQLQGTCEMRISNAVDDGEYQTELFQR